MKKQIHLWVFLTVALVLSSSAHAQFHGVSGDVEETMIYLKPEEAKFLKIINTFRASLGLNELRLHEGLQTAAEKHSQWMATQDQATGKDSLNHNGPTPTTLFSDRIKLEGYASYTTIGENIACGSESAEDTFRQFAFSPSHLQNMMSPRYRHIGISRAGTGKEDCPFYWTNDFGSKASPSTDLPLTADLSRIAVAIDVAVGPKNEGGLTTLQRLAQSQASQESHSTPTQPTRSAYISCAVPYSLGHDVLATAVDTDTKIEINSGNGGYMMKLSYLQQGTGIKFQSVSVFGAAVIKSPFYPLVTVFSAPTTRSGGFMIQIDTAGGRAQFDPYPGHGGSSGLVSCKIQE